MFIAQRQLLPLISYFKVLPFDWYSDHAVISDCIAVEVNRIVYMPAGWKTVYNQFQNWNESSKDLFLKKMSDPIISNKLDIFCQTNFPCSNAAAEQFTEIISGAIKSVFRRKRRKMQKINRHIPYDKELQIAKRHFKKYKGQLSRDPNNTDRRIRFIRERRLYKKLVYKVKKKSQELRLHKMASLEQNDPKAFWKNIKKLLAPPDDGPSIITHPNWFKHFYDVLNAVNPDSTDPQFLKYVVEALPLLETHTELAANLNGPVTAGELNSIMKNTKAGKTTFLDDISNDALKLGLPVLEKAILYLFNNVMHVQTFPESWNEGLIVPIHKKGDKLNVDNYRGIIISSCIGKIFLKVIASRIDSYMNLWCINQCGFKKDHRTEDNLFILNTIHEKYVARGKGSIYLAFIDFSKFFDTINREMLYYKLLKYGISGPVYNVIKSMYSATRYRVKIGDSISPSFLATSGVKQGCPLSPLLSNIYQDDLHKIFDSSCDPVKIGDVPLNSISWADDLLLLSTSKQGLQQSLEKVKAYCYKWGLVVNTEKKNYGAVKTNVYTRMF